ncbi:MAG: hypothetical protein M1837_007355 [Sclerophora amabilis]|nr:MAG: hypothetical protein M1837_007355 [Sclerophora amabilis]
MALASYLRLRTLSANSIPPHFRLSLAHYRCLSTTAVLLKKSSKPSSKSSVPSSTATSAESAPDPCDLTTLDSAIAANLEKLSDELGKIRPGGRVSVEDIESLRVQLPMSKENRLEVEKNSKPRGNTKGMKETVRLSDLAQVIPRGGRGMIFMVGEKEHVKSIQNAILSSPHALTPTSTATPTNPLELHFTIPPPTTSSRTAVLTTATQAGDAAAGHISDARAAQRKRLRTMELGGGGAGKVRADDLRKGMTMMEERVKKADKEVKRMVEACRRKLESG